MQAKETVEGRPHIGIYTLQNGYYPRFSALKQRIGGFLRFWGYDQLFVTVSACFVCFGRRNVGVGGETDDRSAIA